MGGWILISGNNENFENQMRNFRRIFSVSGMPPLHVETLLLSNDLRVSLWSWSKPPVPDITVMEGGPSKSVLILHGIITGLGQFGPAAGVQKEVGTRVLELWDKYGSEIIPELNGSFSCAFVNKREKSIDLFTDRFASRPVWFSREKNIWYAGNYSSSIAAIKRSKPSLHPGGLWSLFATSRHVGSQGIYHGIHNMHAGQEVLLKQEGYVENRNWWRRRYKPVRGISPKQWGEQILEALKTSWKRIEPWTPEPYLFLSGGLDSRIVAGVLGSHLKTVTLTTQHNMNSRIAESIAKHVGSVHQTIVRTPYWYLDSFPAASLIASGNYNIRNAHFMIPAKQISSENNKASFFLGDMLENFQKHYFKKINKQNYYYIPEKIPYIFHLMYSYSHSETEFLKLLFRKEIAEHLSESWKQHLIEVSEAILSVSDDERDCLDTLFRWHNCSCCPTYLMHECIMPLGGSRNLMIDNDMSELMLAIPSDIRGKNILHVRTLWELDKILTFIPNSNFWMPPIFPKRLHEMVKRIRPVIGNVRRKLIATYRKGPIVKTEGSWHMLHEWYRKDNEYKNFIEECIYDKEVFPSDIFNQDNIRNCWQEFLNGNLSHNHTIDMLLSFGLLHRKIPTSGLKLN